jgi:hypothetical protein
MQNLTEKQKIYWKILIGRQEEISVKLMISDLLISDKRLKRRSLDTELHEYFNRTIDGTLKLSNDQKIKKLIYLWSCWFINGKFLEICNWLLKKSKFCNLKILHKFLLNEVKVCGWNFRGQGDGNKLSKDSSQEADFFVYNN